MSGRYPEPDPAAERGVLAGCFRYGRDVFVEVAPMLSEDSFVDEAHRAIWACVEFVLGRQDLSRIDSSTFSSACRQLNVFELLSRPQEKALVQAIARLDLTPEAAMRHAKVVGRLALARRLVDVLRAADDALCNVDGTESPDHILSLAEGPLQEFARSALSLESPGAVPLGCDAREYFEAKLAHPREQVGIPTGFPRYDRVIGGGLRPGNIDLITARQGVGKSLLAVNIALNVARRGIRVLYMDTEMSRHEQLERAGACLSGLPARQVETGRLPTEEHGRLLEAADRLRELPLDHEDIAGLPPDAVVSRARRWVRRTVGLREDGLANPCLIVFDWLKMMDASQIGNNFAEWQVIGFFIDALKDFVKKEGVACLCFGQQNRDGLDHEDSRVVRGGDRIVDTVSSLTLFRRHDDESLEPGASPEQARYTHKLSVIKARWGYLTGPNYINVATELARSYIEEGPTRDELFERQGGRLKGVGGGAVQTR
jgi:replicative DNA helicase